MIKRFQIDGREVRVASFDAPRDAIECARFSKIFDHAVLMGDAPEFWACNKRDARLLEAAGYERLWPERL